MTVCSVPAIVVVAYNRPTSLRRILQSISEADFRGRCVPLIISIDNSGSDACLTVASEFHWEAGPKVVKHAEQRLGLKQHVLRVGDLVYEYGAIIVLEDDLLVSPAFYQYALGAVEAYASDPVVAGISLYSHTWNPYRNLPFIPIDDGRDVYALQIASSWGQVWTVGQWREFRAWLSNKSDSSILGDDLPYEVAKWSTNSWLKFHNKFLVQCGKTFIYPRRSLTTNFSDEGAHAIPSSAYQVPLLSKCDVDFDYSSRQDCVSYDAFFENIGLSKYLGVDDANCVIDLYGGRKFTKRYLLSRERLPYKVVSSFALRLRPWEANVILDISGDDIFFYDLSVNDDPPGHTMRQRSWASMYDYVMRARPTWRHVCGAIFLMLSIKYRNFRRRLWR